MEIKKESSKKIMIKIAKSKTDLIFSENGDFNIKIGENQINHPGEYEYEHINFRLAENKESGFESTFNLASINSEDNINALVMMNNLEIYDSEFNLANVNLLVTNVFDPKELKLVLKKVKPEKVILIDDFLGKEIHEEDNKKLKAQMNAEFLGYAKIKFNSSEFNSDEDSNTQVFVLK